MAAGTVKRMIHDKGFGFLRDTTGTEFFFHRSAVRGRTRFDELQEGDEVTFEIEDSPKGPRAGRVEAA